MRKEIGLPDGFQGLLPLLAQSFVAEEGSGLIDPDEIDPLAGKDFRWEIIRGN